MTRGRRRPQSPSPAPSPVLDLRVERRILVVGGVMIAAAAIVWLTAGVASFISGHGVHDVPPSGAIRLLFRVAADPGSPSSAFPPRLHGDIPSELVFWLVAGVVVAAATGLGHGASHVVRHRRRRSTTRDGNAATRLGTGAGSRPNPGRTPVTRAPRRRAVRSVPRRDGGRSLAARRRSDAVREDDRTRHSGDPRLGRAGRRDEREDRSRPCDGETVCVEGIRRDLRPALGFWRPESALVSAQCVDDVDWSATGRCPRCARSSVRAVSRQRTRRFGERLPKSSSRRCCSRRCEMAGP